MTIEVFQIPSNHIQWQVMPENKGMETRSIIVRDAEVVLKVWEAERWGADCTAIAFVNGARMKKKYPPTVFIGIAELEKWFMEWAEAKLDSPLTFAEFPDVAPFVNQAPVMYTCELCGAAMDVELVKPVEMLICASCRAEVD